jgi:hypothetical protein
VKQHQKMQKLMEQMKNSPKAVQPAPISKVVEEKPKKTKKPKKEGLMEKVKKIVKKKDQ